MNIGKNITALRKDAGMTQEELANQIGVSAQAVSKWETGVSMPDILLLPVIADVFDITVDEIYTGKKETKETKEARRLGYNETPEAVYRAMLETMDRAWYEKGMSVDKMMEEYAKDDRCASFIASEHGGAVYTNGEMGIVLRNFGTRKFLEVLESDKAAKGLELLADEKVRRVLTYLCSLGNKLFTASGIAKKLGMTREETVETLTKMETSYLIYVDRITVADEEELKVYSNSIYHDDSKVMNICLLLKLAEKIQSNRFYFRGYCGADLPIDPEIIK